MTFLLWKHPPPKISLHWVLIVPFALQVLGAVGLVGYLSYRSGQKAVEKLADRLIVETGNRVEQELESYLGKARKVNLTNLAAFQSRVLDLNDFYSLGKYFYRQVRLYDFAYVNFGGADGSFIGAGYGKDQVLAIAEISPANPNTLEAYFTNERGDRTGLHVRMNAFPHQAAWYTDAVRAGKPVWSEIYTWADLPDRISISASAPVYDDGKKLRGVLGIDLELSGIGRFLQGIDRRDSGRIFIFERKSGKLVATSTGESPAPVIGGKARRITGEESQDPIVRRVSRELRARFGDFSGISAPLLSRWSIDRQNLFVRVIPYRDDYGIDWLTVVVVPESEFMTEIWRNWRNTIVLCGLTLLATTGLGIFFARRLARSIHRVSRASQLLAAGKWQESPTETSFIAEIDTLNRSFHRTAERLQESFDRVKIALQASETKFSKVFHSCPDPMSLNTLDDGGRYVEVNESFLELSGYSREEIIDRTPRDLGLSIDPRQEVILEERLRERGFVRGFEYFYRTKSGKSGTSLLSIEIVEIEGKLYTLSISKDITARKLAEAKQRESERKFAKIFQISPDPAWVGTLAEGRIVDVNENMTRFWGYPGEEVKGKTCRDLKLWNNVEDFDYFQKTLTEEGRIQNWEVILRDRSGSARTVLLSATVDRFEGQDLVIGVIVDISDRKQTELELRRTERWLHQFSQHSPSVIYTIVQDLDSSVRCEYISSACEAITGVSAERVLADGKILIEIIHPDDLAAYGEEVIRSAETMEMFSHQWRIIAPSGEIRWLQGKSQPERRENGSIAWYGVVLDITEQKRVERELQRALQQLETHFENSPLAIFHWAIEGRVLRWSRQAEKIFGWTAEEMQALIWDFVYSEDRGQVFETVAPLLRGEATGVSMRNRNYTKDGRIVTCEWYVSAIPDETGNCGSVLCFASDITDRVEAEESLRESEERFRSAFEDTGNGMALVGLDGYFQQVNRSLCEMIGYGEGELLTKSFREITHPDDLGANLAGLDRLLNGQIRVYQVEKRYFHASGRIVWGSVTVSKITDKAGNPLYFVVQIQDISQRHQLDRLKDEFISIVSHELRTPLTSIRGSLGILATGVLEKDPETAHRMLKVALKSSERLVRLVDDILDLERLESGKVDLVLEIHEVGDLLEQALESVSAPASERSIAIEVDFPRARVRADGDAIIQTLTNLLGNAIKFSPTDSIVRVTVRARGKPAGIREIAGDREARFRQNYPHPYLLFSVEDSGRGIPIDKLESIFGRFQQVDVSDARQKGGTGLGLAICKSIVRKHGGDIWAESELEQGSTFYFTLPGLVRENETNSYRR